jgi:hypothetical protein
LRKFATWVAVLVETKGSCELQKKNSLSGKLLLEFFVALVCNVGCPLVATRCPCALQEKIIVCAGGLKLELFCCVGLQRVMLSDCNKKFVWIAKNHCCVDCKKQYILFQLQKKFD